MGIILIIWLTGCKEKLPVYAAFSDQNISVPDCLQYAAMDDRDQKRIETALGMPHDEKCEYRLQLIRYHVGKCDNPAVKSLGSDFDGYVRIEVRKGFEVLYKVQSDYKNDPEAAFERILERAMEDIGHKGI